MHRQINRCYVFENLIRENNIELVIQIKVNDVCHLELNIWMVLRKRR